MTAWAPGQWVQASNGDERFWDGAGWQTGKAPEPPPPVIQATGATAGTPGTFTPEGCEVPANNQILALVATPTEAWAPGEHVTSAGGVDFHWDGDAWALDEAP